MKIFTDGCICNCTCYISLCNSFTDVINDDDNDDAAAASDAEDQAALHGQPATIGRQIADRCEEPDAPRPLPQRLRRPGEDGAVQNAQPLRSSGREPLYAMHRAWASPPDGLTQPGVLEDAVLARRTEATWAARQDRPQPLCKRWRAA